MTFWESERQGRRTRSLLLAVTASLLTLSVFPLGASAGTANAGLPGATSDPISHIAWGIYTGGDDNIYPAYQHARGRAKTLLGEVARRPEAYWFGQSWKYPQVDLHKYIVAMNHGNPDVLAQFTDFSLAPWEGKVCGTVPTSVAQRQYKDWNSAVVRAIGSARVMVVLQPDLPIATAACVPAQTKRIDLADVSWTARKFNSLKHTTVYIDVGASDWLSAGQAATLLIKAGIRDVRGFALDATHFAKTQSQIAYGQQVVRALSARGVRGKHFIIDTAENGHPFTHQQYTKAGGTRADWAARPACHPGRHKARFCQTFGIPPSWQPAAAQWRLGGRYNAIARKLVDGYVWFGRPWMKGQVYPFEAGLTEEMARSTPFPYPKYGNPGAQATSASVLSWPSKL